VASFLAQQRAARSLAFFYFSNRFEWIGWTRGPAQHAGEIYMHGEEPKHVQTCNIFNQKKH
jgi:hypothetical protein